MYKTLTRTELEEKLESEKEVKLVEVLSSEDYKKSHIEGAINIPLAEIGRKTKESFEKDDEIVVYCADFDCQASSSAAKKLDQLGFENVYDYEGGKTEWKQAGNPMASG